MTDSQNRVRVVSAHTSRPNTPESDLQPTVMHDVHLSDGTVVKMMAIDPIDAMDKVTATFGY